MADADNKNFATGDQELEPELLAKASTASKLRGHLKKAASQTQAHSLPPNWKQNKEQQRQWCRRRLRRLFIADKHATRRMANRVALRRRRSPRYWYSMTLLAIVAVLFLCFALYRNGDVLAAGMRQLLNQFKAKLNYCDRTKPLDDAFAKVRGGVPNQDVALDQLEQTLAQQNSFQSIALVGLTGLGQSLTVGLLKEHFPWPENVASFVWNGKSHVEEPRRFHIVQSLLKTLAYCGRNLLIIDNMSLCDMEFVTAINELVLSRNDVANGSYNPDMKQLSIIYVFNLNNKLPHSDYVQQLEALEQLPQTTVIGYQGILRSELELCGRQVAQQVLMPLNDCSNFLSYDQAPIGEQANYST